MECSSFKLSYAFNQDQVPRSSLSFYAYVSTRNAHTHVQSCKMYLMSGQHKLFIIKITVPAHPSALYRRA